MAKPEVSAICEKVMDHRLGKFSDREIALLLGALNTGEISMATRLICEASYRLARAGGSVLTDQEEDELIDEIMTCEYRLRMERRKQRRKHSKKKGGLPERASGRGYAAVASAGLRLVQGRKGL